MYGSFLYRMFNKNFSIERICIYVISIIIAIFAFVYFFNITDRIPATEEDFEELHQTLLQVQNNPEEFMKHKGTISIYDDKIRYEIENDQCKVEAKYTLDYELIEYIKKDKASPTLVTIIICGMIAVLFIALSSFILFLLILIVESIVIGIILLVKKIKRIRVSKRVSKVA